MAKSKKAKPYIIMGIVAFAVILFLSTGPLYIVDEGNQVVVTRLGRIVSTHTDAGLYVKIPFLDQVTTYPSKILSLDGDPARIPTKENQYIIVDTTSRWRITDPALFYQSIRTIESAYIKLGDIIDSSTRTVISNNRLAEIVRSSNIINDRQNTSEELSGIEEEDSAEIEALINGNIDLESVTKGRSLLCGEMLRQAQKAVAEGEFGIELLDIVPRQVKYSDELTESVYNRMIKERNQVAQAYRSLGEGKKAEWQGKLQKEKATIQSEAYKKAEEIKGAADAQATAIYAEAYSKDPDFFAFWKSLESYKSTMGNFDTTYSTNLDYFKYLYGSDGKR